MLKMNKNLFLCNAYQDKGMFILLNVQGGWSSAAAQGGQYKTA